jgi:hypothetical protein
MGQNRGAGHTKFHRPLIDLMSQKPLSAFSYLTRWVVSI